MKDKFYNSKAWRNLAKHIRIKYRGVCQSCGIAGTHVHHIKHINSHNINDPQITLNEKNLTLLCQECHNSAHADERYVRKDVTFDENGMIMPISPPIRT